MYKDSEPTRVLRWYSRKDGVEAEEGVLYGKPHHLRREPFTSANGPRAVAAEPRPWRRDEVSHSSLREVETVGNRGLAQGCRSGSAAAPHALLLLLGLGSPYLCASDGRCSLIPAQAFRVMVARVR